MDNDPVIASLADAYTRGFRECQRRVIEECQAVATRRMTCEGAYAHGVRDTANAIAAHIVILHPDAVKKYTDAR